MSMGTDEDFFDDIPGIPDMIGPAGSGADPVRQEGDSYFSKFRAKRQNNNFNRNRPAGATPNPNTNSASRNQSSQRLNPGPTNTENTGRWGGSCFDKGLGRLNIWHFPQGGRVRVESWDCDSVLGVQFGGQDPGHREYTTLWAGYSPGGLHVSVKIICLDYSPFT